MRLTERSWIGLLGGAARAYRILKPAIHALTA